MWNSVVSLQKGIVCVCVYGVEWSGEVWGQMKGTGKLSGTVMQIAFILTALHSQSAPAMTSLWNIVSPPFLFPHLLQLFIFFLFHAIFSHLSSDFPHSFDEYPSIYFPWSFSSLPRFFSPSFLISEDFLLHLLYVVWEINRWEFINGEF